MTTSPPREDFRLRSVAVAAYGPTILEGIGYGAAIPIVPLLARSSEPLSGRPRWLPGSSAWASCAPPLPAGAMIARIGERRAMVIARSGAR